MYIYIRKWKYVKYKRKITNEKSFWYVKHVRFHPAFQLIRK